LVKITDRAPPLLIGYDYDQRLLDEPPISGSNKRVGRQYQESYDLKLLANSDTKGGVKQKMCGN
jgi:thiopurine S-methyltransferase